jgi:hypothetical protein
MKYIVLAFMWFWAILYFSVRWILLLLWHFKIPKRFCDPTEIGYDGSKNIIEFTKQWFS